MMRYLLLIQGNTKSETTNEDWERFIGEAQKLGVFEGGSALAGRQVLGDAETAGSSAHVAGYMMFEAERKEDLLRVLEGHPVVERGGTVELFELIRT